MKLHTPGPWIARTILSKFVEGQILAAEILGPDGNEICEINYAETSDSDIPNAFLIASAPEMLAALQIMLDEFSSKECGCDGEYVDGRLRGDACYFHRVEDQLREAIAKATRGGK